MTAPVDDDPLDNKDRNDASKQLRPDPASNGTPPAGHNAHTPSVNPGGSKLSVPSEKICGGSKSDAAFAPRRWQMISFSTGSVMR